ncbi:MAG TPA: RodZ domain-containing protein [Rhodanobacteraceae bacterium]|nr:RodZ domain-containing protein [Rhodanobacteraceae bacterium]
MSSSKRQKGSRRQRQAAARKNDRQVDLLQARAETPEVPQAVPVPAADEPAAVDAAPTGTPAATEPAGPAWVAAASTDDAPQADHVTSLADLGARLRAARIARDLTLEDAGRRLRLPARVLRKLEEDELTGIDCPVYLRGYLRSYGKLLGVDLPPLQPTLARAAVAPPKLTPTGGISRRRYLWQRYSVVATYMIITALVVVPVVVLGLNSGLHHQGARVAPLESAPTASTALADAGLSPGRNSSQPLMASMAPFGALHDDIAADAAAAPSIAAPAAPDITARPAAAAATAGEKHEIDIDLAAPSWVEITDAAGERLEYGLLPAGEHSYHSNRVLDIRLGNSVEARVSVNGKPFDLQPYRRANVAQFRLDPATGAAPTSGSF